MVDTGEEVADKKNNKITDWREKRCCWEWIWTIETVGSQGRHTHDALLVDLFLFFKRNFTRRRLKDGTIDVHSSTCREPTMIWLWEPPATCTAVARLIYLVHCCVECEFKMQRQCLNAAGPSRSRIKLSAVLGYLRRSKCLLRGREPQRSQLSADDRQYYECIHLNPCLLSVLVGAVGWLLVQAVRLLWTG